MTQIGDSLADCALGTSVRVLAVDWDRLDPAEGRRLRALGLDAGAVLRLAHRGIFVGRDPIALEIGRMTIALRRSHALAVSVEPAPEEAPHPAAERPNDGTIGVPA
ncbi:ferrous iron transport protein A [Croceicoccus marinus]|uniref:Ferrous iron transport protein A n=2 Tax=Croceicoccus marinus TaxID=450378 RepID=A0A7G6VYC0_9SPHN|nr:FeoA family protein [Croceicoccus marinus]QNE06735.1 ferrous iron transport protein A [Croceicoccus marinus]